MERPARLELAALLILAAAGAALRLHNLGGQGLWHDEMFTLLYGKGQMEQFLDGHVALLQPLAPSHADLHAAVHWQPAQVIRGVYALEPSHSPLWYLIIHAFVVTLGVSESVLRLPSTLFSVLTIPLVYLLGRRLRTGGVGLNSGGVGLNSGGVGLVAALVCALAPLQVYYAQEARMYSLVVMLAVLSSWLLSRLSGPATDPEPAKRWQWWLCWLAWSGTTALGLYAQALYVVPLGLQVLWVFGWRRGDRRLLRAFLAALGLAGVAYLPWVVARLLWSPPSGVSWLAGGLAPLELLDAAWLSAREFLWLDDGWLPELWPLWLAPLATGLWVARSRATIRVVVAFVLGPAAAVILTDALGQRHASQFGRYFVLAAPPLYLLVAAGVQALPRWPARAVLALLCAQLAVSSVWTAQAQILPRNDEWKRIGLHLAAHTSADDGLVLASWDRIFLAQLAFEHRGGVPEAWVPENLAMLAAPTGRKWLASQQTITLILPTPWGSDPPQPDADMARLGPWQRTSRTQFGNIWLFGYRRLP